MKTIHLSLILMSSILILILVTFFSNNVEGSSQSSVITVGPQNLPVEIENILHYVSCGGTPVLSGKQLSQFVLDNNPNLKNQSLAKSKILDLVVPTIEKKLVIESTEFKLLHGNNDSIVFDQKHNGPLPAVCFAYGSIGTFQTDSKERYRVNIGISPAYTYSFTIYPDLGPQSTNTQKYLVITQVELASKNGTEWITLYNPNAVDVPLGSLYISGSNGESKYFDHNSTLEARDSMIVQLNNLQPSWSHLKNIISLDSSYPDIYGNDLDTNAKTDSPTIWDKTPALTDTYNDSRTWQFDGNKWVFVEQDTKSIPEFPFAIPVLVFSIISVIVFYRVKFR